LFAGLSVVERPEGKTSIPKLGSTVASGCRGVSAGRPRPRCRAGYGWHSKFVGLREDKNPRSVNQGGSWIERCETIRSGEGKHLRCSSCVVGLPEMWRLVPEVFFHEPRQLAYTERDFFQFNGGSSEPAMRRKYALAYFSAQSFPWSMSSTDSDGAIQVLLFTL
jgi:hypothetical protein